MRRGHPVHREQDGQEREHETGSAESKQDDEGAVVREAAQETGFLRPQEDRTLELVLAHNTGFVEVWHGEIHPDRPQLDMVTDTVARTATAKAYTAGKRLYGYVEGDLLYAYDMAAMGQELQPHTWAQLQRGAGAGAAT